MIELKLTKKWDGKIKGLHFEEGTLIDENGEVVNLNEWMKAAYGDRTFDLSVTAKEEEIIECELEENDDEE